MQRSLTLSLSLLALVLFSSCRGRRSVTTVVVEPDAPRTVSIDAEIFDPDTNLVWEGVGVRVIEAFVEDVGAFVVSPFVDDFLVSDGAGLVFFSPADIAAAEVGFLENGFREAILQVFTDADEATIVLEVFSPGFIPVEVEVDISWFSPDAVISIPFEDTFVPLAEGASSFNTLPRARLSNRRASRDAERVLVRGDS